MMILQVLGVTFRCSPLKYCSPSIVVDRFKQFEAAAKSLGKKEILHLAAQERASIALGGEAGVLAAAGLGPTRDAYLSAEKAANSAAMGLARSLVRQRNNVDASAYLRCCLDLLWNARLMAILAWPMWGPCGGAITFTPAHESILHTQTARPKTHTHTHQSNEVSGAQNSDCLFCKHIEIYEGDQSHGVG
jgi:hypothetical protein